MVTDLYLTEHTNGASVSSNKQVKIIDNLNAFFKATRPVIEVDSSDYSANAYESIMVTTGATTRTITLPVPVADTYQCVEISKIDVGIGDITVDTIGAEKINGLSTDTITGQYGAKRYINNGGDWIIF